MPWFKVDDGLSDHPKVLMAGNAAMGLWVRSGAWSMKHLTDGFIPAAVVSLLGSTKEARQLVSAGLWVPVEGGFRFHEWESLQRSKETVKQERDAAAERQKRARDKARESRRDGDVTHGGSNGPPVQSSPVQSQTLTDVTSDGSSQSPTQPRESTTDQDRLIQQATRDARALGVLDLPAMRAEFERKLGLVFTLGQTVELCQWVLSKRRGGLDSPPDNPPAYIIQAVRKTSPEWRERAKQLGCEDAA